MGRSKKYSTPEEAHEAKLKQMKEAYNRRKEKAKIEREVKKEEVKEEVTKNKPLKPKKPSPPPKKPNDLTLEDLNLTKNEAMELISSLSKMVLNCERPSSC